jgi:hypothetical protein
MKKSCGAAPEPPIYAENHCRRTEPVENEPFAVAAVAAIAGPVIIRMEY